MELDYYHYKLNLRVTSPVAERRKVLGNEKILVKSQNWVHAKTSTQSPLLKKNFVITLGN